MKKNVSIIAFRSDERVKMAVQQIQAWAKSAQNIELYVSENGPLAEWPGLNAVPFDELRSSEMVISVGGDGTFLSAARLVYGQETPILGVHTGLTGFLADFSVDGLAQELEAWSKNELHIRPRMMLSIVVERFGRVIYSDFALNEIHIKPSLSQQMIALNVELNGRVLTDYWADSLLISTPTGSTAYNLSAHGPILHPSAEVMILNPVNPPSLSVRPLVVPIFSHLRIATADYSGVLLMDGRVDFGLEPLDVIKVSQSPFRTLFIKSPRYGFVNALRDKLGWSGQVPMAAARDFLSHRIECADD
jgi:NAD+ kinase